MHKESLAQAFRDYGGQVDDEIGPGPSSPIRTVSGKSRTFESRPQTPPLELTEAPSNIDNSLPGETVETEERHEGEDNNSHKKENLKQKDGEDFAEVDLTENQNEVHVDEQATGMQEHTPSLVLPSNESEDIGVNCIVADEDGSTESLTKELDDGEIKSNEDLNEGVQSSDLSLKVETSVQSESLEAQEKATYTETSSELESSQVVCANIPDTLIVHSSIVSTDTIPQDSAIQEVIAAPSLPTENFESLVPIEEGAVSSSTNGSNDIGDKKSSTLDAQSSDKKIAKLDVSSIASDTENLELKASSNGESDQPLKVLHEVFTFNSYGYLLGLCV